MSRLLRVVRAWLRRNKVFFDTMLVICLSFMALVVAYQANRIAKVQTRLFERQTQILETESRPYVSISVERRYRCEEDRDIDSGAYELWVTVKNVGAPLGNLEIVCYEFLEANMINNKVVGVNGRITGRAKTVFIPLDYFLIFEITQETSGSLAVLRPVWRGVDCTYGKRMLEIGNWNYPRDEPLFVFLQAVIAVSYDTSLGERCLDVFHVTGSTVRRVGNDWLKEEEEKRGRTPPSLELAKHILDPSAYSLFLDHRDVVLTMAEVTPERILGLWEEASNHAEEDN